MRVPETIPEWLDADKREFDNCVAPTNWHRLIAVLADCPEGTRNLMRNTAPFPAAPFEHELTESEAALRNEQLAKYALFDFLNSCVAPVSSIKKEHTFHNTGDMNKRLDTCEGAEVAFAKTFDTIQLVNESEYKTPNANAWITIVDGSNQPIAIKKHDGIHSALSLVPLTIDGCSYPAGSLLRIDLSPTELPEKSRGYSTSASNIENIKFLRLSGFTHSPEERQRLFVDILYSRPFASAELSEITKLVQENIPVCTELKWVQKTLADLPHEDAA